MLAVNQVRQEAKRGGLTDIKIEEVFVLLDREQGASEKATELGFRLNSLIPFVTKGLPWLRGSFTDIEYEIISGYMSNPQGYQEPSVREELVSMARR